MARPARAMPDDFPEVFEREGWEGTPAHYRAHGVIVARWINQAGRETLRQRRRNYVLGNRLNRSAMQ
jgi:hypothetical protein